MIEIIDTIFIDTSVFQRESFFKSTSRITKLFELAKQGYIRILLPIITEKEWFKHLQDGAKLEFSEMERRLSMIGSNKKVAEFLEKHSELRASLNFDDELKKTFYKYIHGPGVYRIDYSYFEDSLKIVFDKYFRQEKPFGNKGKSKEFPDAFALAALEKFALENSIDKIVVFSTDNDIKDYKSDVLHVEEIGIYLDDLITNKIPTAHREEQLYDIKKLLNFINNCPLPFKQKLYYRVEVYLSDPYRYLRRFAYSEIEEVYDVDIEIEITTKDLEIISINENEIEAVVYPHIEGSVFVRFLNEEESLWDPEDREWISPSYEEHKVEISSYVAITVNLDRRELDMGQLPGVSMMDVDFAILQDSIDDDRFYS